MSGYAPLPSAPLPQTEDYNPPPAYNYPGATSYGSVGQDIYPTYQQPSGYAPQPTGYNPQPSGYAPQFTGYDPQPTGYSTGYQQQPVNPVYNATTTVVTTQPGVPKYRPPKPSTHIWLSVFTMLCCCFLLGLIAIIVGLEVDTAYNLGDDTKARKRSQQALGLSIAAIGIGVVFHLVWIGLVVYVFAIAGANTNIKT